MSKFSLKISLTGVLTSFFLIVGLLGFGLEQVSGQTGCVVGTSNRIAGTWHSDLYIASNTTAGTNDLYAWGQNMVSIAGLTATTPVTGTNTSDVYTPTLINTSAYNGIPYEVRGSSPSSSTSVFGLRTSTRLYVFGDAVTSITNWSSFGGGSLSTGDVTSKLPTGVTINDISTFRISASAIALLTNAGNVYMMSKGSTNSNFNILGDKSTTEFTSTNVSATTSTAYKVSGITSSISITIASKPALNIGDAVTLSNGTNSVSGTVNTYNATTGVLTISPSSNTGGNSTFTSWTVSYNISYWHQVKLSDGVTPLSGVTKLSVSGAGAMALTSTGKLYYWGDGNPYNNTTPVAYNYAFDISTAVPTGTNVSDVLVVGKQISNLYLLGADGYVYSCGTNTNGILGVNNATLTAYSSTFQKVKKVSDGVNSSTLNNLTKIDGGNNGNLNIVTAMNSSGQIFGWGDNNQYGMLGTIKPSSGNNTDYSGAIQIFTSTTAQYSTAVSGNATGGTATSTASPGSGFSDYSVGGHFIVAFYTNSSTGASQYWYHGHNTNGSIGYDPSAVVQSGNTFGPQSNIASIYAPTYLNATAGISFSCSNTQPTILKTGSFLAFSACTNIASNTQSITISGLNLSANITVSAPAGFEVSTSAGSGFASTATLTQNAGTVASTIIYVRITSTTTGTVSGTLSCTSTGAASATFTLTGTVNTLPVITTLTGATRTGAGTVTISGNTATAGATIDWYQNSTGGTALATGVNSTTSYTTGTISSTTNYFAEARNLTTGCISATRSMTTATINGSFSAGVIGTDQTICNGKTPNALTSISDASGGTGVISYQWQQSTTSSSAGFTNISGQTLSTYTPGALTVNTWFRRAAITSVDGTIYSSAIAITVNALPTASTPIDNSRTGAGPVIIGASASSGATIDWYAASTGGTVLTGGNGVTTYTTPSISVTTTYFAEARTTTSPGCISANRIPVLATINGSFAPGSITADQSICAGSTAATLTSITEASGGTGTITYTWLKSTTSASSGFYTATGTYTSSTYAAGTLTQTTYFKRTAKTTTSSDGTIETNVITITVNPLPLTPTGVNGSRYGTGTVNISASVNSSTSETIDWYDVATGGSILSGGTGTTSFITPSISTTTNYYAQARNATTGCISAARATVIATINVAATLTVNGTLSPFTSCSGIASATQTITVAGSSLTSNITLAALAGYEYSTDGTSFSNSLVLTKSGSNTVSTTTIYIRLTSTASNGAGGNIVVSTTGASDVNVATGAATINVAPAITVQPSSATQNLVQNANATALSVTATGSNLTYQWYSNVSNANTGGSSIAGATHASYTPLTATIGTLYYYVIVSGSCSPAAVSSVSGSIVTSASTSPTIGHTGDLHPFVECAGNASDPQSFVISGSSLTNDIVINALTGYEYALSASGTYSSTLTLTQSGGTVSATTIYVRLINGASNGDGGNINVTSSGATTHLISTGSATINSAPAITVQPSTSIQTLVKNATSTALSVTATGSNLTYQWYSNSNNSNSTGTIITGATSATYTPSTSSVGSLYYYVIVSGTCTPAVTSNVSGLITVNGAASITSSSAITSFTTCAGSTSASQTFTVAGSNLTADISIGSLSGYEYSINGVSFANSLVIPRTGNSVSTTTIYVRLSSSAVNGDGGDIVISSAGAVDNLVNTGAATVNALPTITTQPSTTGETLIQNSTSGLYSVSASGAGLTYQWHSNTTNSNSGGSLISGATNNSYRPSSANIGTTYYYVVITGTCSSVTSNVTGAIVINAAPSITVNGTLTNFNACSGTESAEQTFTVAGTNLTDDILVLAPSGYEVSTTTGTGFASSVLLPNTAGTISTTTIYIRLTNTANNGDGGNVTASSSSASSQNIATGTANVSSNTISLTSATGTDAQTVNQNSSIVNITYSTTGATGATFSGLPTGVNGVWSANTITISGAPSVSGNSTYTITLTGGCGTATSSGSINSLNSSLGNSTIVVTGATTYTYTGATQGPTTSSKTGSTASPTYSYSGTGGTSYGPSATPPTTPGNYQVVATLAGDPNYNGATSAAYAFTINKAASTIVVSGATSYTANGSAQGPTSSAVTGSTGAVTYTYLGTGGTTYGPSSTPPTQVGTYQVIATVALDPNYNGATSAAYAFTINAATPTIGNSTIVVTGPTTYTYNGSVQGPTTSTVTGSNGSVTYSYVGTGGTTYGPSATLPKLPGTYQVIATVAANYNYNGATSTAYAFTINQTIAPPAANNGTYILNQSGIPTSLSGLIKTTPTGTIPVWCNVATSVCATTPPTMPTAVGRYVYQVRTYDTVTMKYSDNYINDTLTILPPAPKAIDSTFVLGVSANPANVGVQVTGLSGAVLNYYYANTKLVNVPALGTVAIVKKYAVSQTINSIESDTASFTTTILDPNGIIHLQKIVDSGILQVNSTFNYPVTLVVTNLTKYPFSNVVVTDNLHNSVPISSEFSIVKNTANGGLVSNHTFDGNNDIKVTSASSSLGAFAKDTAKFTMNLIPKGYTGTLSNIAYVTADTKWGTIVMQSSSSSASNNTATKNSTTYFVKDLRIYIPEGFSPNHDGVHDKFVVIRPYGVTLDIQVFNRWGNIVYTNSNYQNDWDGKGTGNFAGQDLVDGGYYYSLRAVDENGKVQLLKGSVIIQR